VTRLASPRTALLVALATVLCAALAGCTAEPRAANSQMQAWARVEERLGDYDTLLLREVRLTPGDVPVWRFDVRAVQGLAVYDIVFEVAGPAPPILRSVIPAEGAAGGHLPLDQVADMEDVLANGLHHPWMAAAVAHGGDVYARVAWDEQGSRSPRPVLTVAIVPWRDNETIFGSAVVTYDAEGRVRSQETRTEFLLEQRVVLRERAGRDPMHMVVPQGGATLLADVYMFPEAERDVHLAGPGGEKVPLKGGEVRRDLAPGSWELIDPYSPLPVVSTSVEGQLLVFWPPAPAQDGVLEIKP
jgi:hypothetical protein